MRIRRHTAPALAGVFTLSLVASIALRAEQGRGGGAAAGPTLVPLAASSLATHPELYIGQTVAITAAVGKSLSATTFTINQGKAALPAGTEVLVIAQSLTDTPKAGDYVYVIGDAVKFDPADVAKRLKGYTLDLPADVVQKYLGKPVVLATSVLNTSMTDLAKKKIPPPTPAEDAFDQVMKQVNPAMTALRAGITASDAAAVKKSTTDLKKIFTETQAFFKTRGTVDAQGWAGDALKFLETIDTASSTAKWPDATAASTGLGGLCTSCHNAHRERMDDGTYRVKG